MSILNRLANFQGQRSDLPNQALARELAAKKDKRGIQEIAENLWNKDRNIQSDCIKVLYEIGYLQPELIADYASDFLKLLKSRNNRLVWGSLIALSTVAALRAELLFAHWQDIRAVMERGTVITMDAGVKALAQVAAHSDAYRGEISPYLLAHLKTCRPQSVAQHAEAVLVAVDAAHRADFLKVLEKRLEDLSAGAAGRVKRVMKAAAG
jgi:hypothetical protein